MSRQFGKPELRMFLLEMANYQDNLLQTYRNIFIASQTIIISIATLIISFSNLQLRFTFIFQLIIGATIIFYWKNITYTRGLDVSYCHMQLEKLEKGIFLSIDEKHEPFRSFKNWQKKSKIEKERTLKDYDYADKEDKRNIFKSYTRDVMGQKLPLVFSFIWVLISLTFILTLIFPIK